jgi:1-acyl-sn-glycerol-3-phosphate acyltransferase
MARQDIKKYSMGYALVRLIASLYHRLYYRKLILKYREKVPVNSPVIFSINHQNALMDALAIVFTMPGQVVFMARADIFSKKAIAAILYFLKILPAYRIRDGFHSVDQNKEVFKEVIDAIEHNRPFAILPEGNHFGQKRLRPLKKGAARLALLAEEANDFKLGLSIVPVGVDYSNYYKPGSDLLIVFGDPVKASDYREQYLENPTLAINSLTADLAGAMKKVMINIEPEEHYQAFHDAVEMYSPVELKKQGLRPGLWNSFRIKKELAETLRDKMTGKETEIAALKDSLKNYNEILEKKGIRDCQVTGKHINVLTLFLRSLVSLLFLPLHIYGVVMNYLPYGLPTYLSRNIKDAHFISSIRFVLGLLFFFIWHLLLIALSFIIFNQVLFSLAFIISLPLTGIFAFYYYTGLLKLRGDFRWMILKTGKKSIAERLISERKEITRLTELLLQ